MFHVHFVVPIITQVHNFPPYKYMSLHFLSGGAQFIKRNSVGEHIWGRRLLLDCTEQEPLTFCSFGCGKCLWSKKFYVHYSEEMRSLGGTCFILVQPTYIRICTRLEFVKNEVYFLAIESRDESTYLRWILEIFCHGLASYWGVERLDLESKNLRYYRYNLVYYKWNRVPWNIVIKAVTCQNVWVISNNSTIVNLKY